MRVAYFDLVGGAAGDMLLGALIDAGAPVPALEAAIASLGVGARLTRDRENRQFLQATRVQVQGPAEDPPHRHLQDVLDVVAQGDLPESVRGRVGDVFRALAAAEGQVHGIAPEAVHFHEVGAVDSIVDTVGVVLALELLGVERVEASPLPVGRGTVQGAHGSIPLPGPALLALAQQTGAVIQGRDEPGELVTPTAAALLGTLATRFGPYPSLVVEAVGYGAGARKNPVERPPNVTRVVLGRIPTAAQAGEVVVLETAIDDQTAELTGYLSETLLAAGALDVYVAPIQMKKNRPGVQLTVLAEPQRAGALEDLLLRESSTLGVRRRRESRTLLPREVVSVETVHGSVRVKLTTRPGGRRSAAPEFEDCARLARDQGLALEQVYREALVACQELLR